MCTSCRIQTRMAEVSAEQHDPRSEWLRAELAILQERWNVRDHPFHVRWSRGELPSRDHAGYAAQHGALVAALAGARAAAARGVDDPFALLRAAEAVLRAHWSVLDELDMKASTWQ